MAVRANSFSNTFLWIVQDDVRETCNTEALDTPLGRGSNEANGMLPFILTESNYRERSLLDRVRMQSFKPIP
jgi:hypothetical protein